MKTVAIGLLALLASVSAFACPVNINTASAEELKTLKNVGDAKAEDIIKHRESQPFEVPEDLLGVKGIGEATLEANKDCIAV